MCKRVFARVSACVHAYARPGSCFMRFISGAAVCEHFRSYFQRRETSWGKATGGSSRCCTFKGQIAPIYATAVCQRPEERLLAAVPTCPVCLRQRGKKKNQNWAPTNFFFSRPITVLTALFSSTVFKGRFGRVLKYRKAQSNLRLPATRSSDAGGDTL